MVDQLRLVSKPTCRFISTVISKLIYKKSGYPVKLDLGCFETIVDGNGRLHGHIDLKFDLDKDDYDRLLKTIRIA